MVSTRSNEAACTSVPAGDNMSSSESSPTPADASTATTSTGNEVVSLAPGLQRFTHLAKKMKADNEQSSSTTGVTNVNGSVPCIKIAQAQLDQYMCEIADNRVAHDTTDILSFWRSRRTLYSLLAPVAEDLLSAPASQAYVERVFSVCGWLTSGRRNRLTKNLAMRAFMKLNKNIL